MGGIMTLTEIITSCRQRYNAYGSTFWGNDEIIGLIYEACMSMAVETECIEKTFSTSTIIGTQEYDLPEHTIGIKRVTWKGVPLLDISFKEDDLTTAFDESTLDQGDPAYYVLWENKIRLRPIPGSIETLKAYCFNQPQPLTSVSILEIPVRYHIYILDYVIAYMIMKDSNFNVAENFLKKWELNLQKIKSVKRKLKRAGGFAGVKSIDDVSYQKWI
jgi:hypothetical protein